MKKYLKIFLLFPILALFTVQSFAQSSAGYQYLEPGQKQTFNFQNICREITNNSSSRILIPSQSLNEYGSFLAYPPSGVVIEPCCSSLQDKEAYEYEACPDGTNGYKYRKVTVDYGACTSFNGVFEDESPPAPKYGPWQGSCSVCPTSPGCGFGYDRNDYCAEWNPVVVVAGVPQPQTCKKWDFTCNYNCNNTIDKASEQFNKSQANICGGFPDITNRSDVIHGSFNNYGNATGLTIPGYELSRGSCTQSMTCTASIQTRAIEICPAGQIMQTAGTESRTLNQNNVCGNHSPFAVTLAPVCVAAPSVNGVCGASHGGKFAAKPSSDLCSQGTASSVATMTNTWDWNCSGTGIGSNASCQADILKALNPVGGPACGGTTTGAPTPSQACTAGDFSNLNLTPDGKIYTWKCSNPADSNDSISCSSSNIITPVCGSANNSAAIVEPDAATLCSTGTSKSFVKDGNVWKWSCEGNVAADVSCSTQAVNMCTSQFYEAAYELNSATNEKDSIQVYCPAGKQFKYQYKSFTMVGPNTNMAGNFSTNYYATLGAANNSTSTYCEDLPSGCSQTTGGEWCAIWNSGWGSVPATNGTKPANATVYSDSGMYAVGDGSKGKPFTYWPNCTVGEYAVNSGVDIVGSGGSTQTYFKCIDAADDCSTHVVKQTNSCENTFTVGYINSNGTTGTELTTCPSGKYLNDGAFSGGTVFPVPSQIANNVGFNKESQLQFAKDSVCYVRTSCGSGTPQAGICGSANGVSVMDVPTTNLCSYGSITSGPLDNGTKYDWVCQGDTGTTGTSCSAPKTGGASCDTGFECVYKDAGNIYINGFDVLCPNGQFAETASFVVPDLGGFNTQDTQCQYAKTINCKTKPECTGGGGGTTPTTGTCGSSNGQSFSGTPTSDLCGYGTSSSVSLTGSTYSWTCQGDNTTLPKSCTANKVTYASACGTSNGQSFSAAPTSNLCASGVIPTVTDNGNHYSWGCVLGSGLPDQPDNPNVSCMSDMSGTSYSCVETCSATKTVAGACPTGSLTTEQINAYYCGTGGGVQGYLQLVQDSYVINGKTLKDYVCDYEQMGQGPVITECVTSTTPTKTCTWTSKENLDDVRSWCYTRQLTYQQTGLSNFCDGINVNAGDVQNAKSDGTFEHTNCIDDPIPGFDKTFDYCSGLNSDFTMAQNLECIEN